MSYKYRPHTPIAPDPSGLPGIVVGIFVIFSLMVGVVIWQDQRTMLEDVVAGYQRAAQNIVSGCN